MEITLKIDQRKKEAKALIEYLRNLPFVEVETKQGLGKVEKEKITPKQRKLINTLKRVKRNADSGNYKTQSIESFLNEL